MSKHHPRDDLPDIVFQAPPPLAEMHETLKAIARAAYRLLPAPENAAPDAKRFCGRLAMAYELAYENPSNRWARIMDLGARISAVGSDPTHRLVEDRRKQLKRAELTAANEALKDAKAKLTVAEDALKRVIGYSRTEIQAGRRG